MRAHQLVRLTVRGALLIGLLLSSSCAVTSSGPTLSGDVTSEDAGGHPSYSSGGMPVVGATPGNFTAYLVNTADVPVRVVSARPIPVPGYPSGRLTHVARFPGKDSVATGSGWPPSIPVVPLVRTTIPQGTVMVSYAIQGRKVGPVYAVAGVELTIREGGELHRVRAFGGGEICLVPNKSMLNHTCDARFARADQAVEKFTDAQPD